MPSLCECVEIAVLSFVGLLNAVVNTQAVARYLAGNVVLSQPTGRAAGCLDHEERERA
jgi:hypothetical protein